MSNNQITDSIKKGIANTINNAGFITGGNAVLKGENVAGRDQYNTTINNKTENRFDSKKLNFTEINLKPFENDNYPLPNFVDDVYEKIFKEKIMIIGGNYEFDKNTFINFLAYKIKGLNESYQVKGWGDRSEKVNLFTALSEEPDSTIFVFNDLNPLLLNYNLKVLLDLAVRHNHYILISTDLELRSWQLPDHLKDTVWYEVPLSNIFSKEVLCDCVINEIENSKEKITYRFPIDNLTKESKLSESYTVSSLAELLTSIKEIEIFFISLTKNKTFNDREVNKALKKTKDSKLASITQWFNTLGKKEKEVAIVLSIFDGLLDDQFFGAVEKLVNSSWKNRESNLATIDYSDLDELLMFFELRDIGNGQKIIKSRNAEQRPVFLNTIWYSHRRQLLSSMQVLESITYESIYK